MKYKETLLLPKTGFPMKPDFHEVERAANAKWDGIYDKIRKDRHGKPVRMVHDGPPYANGYIHLGHALNKIIKDIIVRFLTMEGYDSSFRPGWDCHGLPIEQKAKSYIAALDQPITPEAIKSFCFSEAMKWVHIQREQFKRLGLLADWDNPYLTTQEDYKQNVLDVLDAVNLKGLISRKSKPVDWCPYDATILAEAEVEYKTIASDAVYVAFPTIIPCHGLVLWLVAWTTTPWSLPGNVALAVNPNLKYTYIKVGSDPLNILGRGSELVVVPVASALVDPFLQMFSGTPCGTVIGSDLVGMTYNKQFSDGFGVVVAADYVTDTEGTGIVHIAPGHGSDDHLTAVEHALDIPCPIDEYGNFVGVKGLEGKTIRDVDFICDFMHRYLWHREKHTHSYPHCSRCSNPIITRATSQWFINLDSLRNGAIEAIRETRWIPQSMQNRMETMVASRPEWCISRQRVWGIGIPTVECARCGWRRIYGQDATAIFCRCGGECFRKETDILDVWFESGASFRSVLPANPAEVIYCEGSDQHRGWFQSSLWLGMIADGKPPFHTVITHGWVVDETGRKLAKSSGAHSVSTTLDNFGADVLRWFVSSQDFTGDLRVNDAMIEIAQESYRKLSNTFRFILGNLQDFCLAEPYYANPSNMIDVWVLACLKELVLSVKDNYYNYDFVGVYHRVSSFCITTLSNIYFDSVKDRLYADPLDSESGKNVRYCLREIYDTLVLLIAPILPHLAEMLWSYRHKTSVFFESFPHVDKTSHVDVCWDRLLDTRNQINIAIEPLRSSKVVKQNEEVSVSLGLNLCDLEPYRDVIRVLCKLSEVIFDKEQGTAVVVRRTDYARCDRCWRHMPGTTDLCSRCRAMMAMIEHL